MLYDKGLECRCEKSNKQETGKFCQSSGEHSILTGRRCFTRVLCCCVVTVFNDLQIAKAEINICIFENSNFKKKL